jgi:tRNA1Val (adenine37-N6)-methyltransferase
MSAIVEKFLARKTTLETELGEELTISGLTGPLRIFQRRNGHRHSIDDTTTAWYALKKSPHAKRILDLGSGIGSVGLVVLWELPQDATLTCIEAQDVSFACLKANIECNGLSERVRAHQGDLRNLALDERFDLITGSPPYFPIGTGVLPQDSQKAHARFELRGHVGDYARVARQHLSDDGTFVFCFPFQQKARGMQLVTEAGLHLATVQEVIPMPSKPALFSLFSATLNPVHALTQEAPLIVADETGRYTAEMEALQRTRGFGPAGTNTEWSFQK